MSSRIRSLLTFSLLGCAGLSACATIPENKLTKFHFPKNAYVGDVKRPYIVLGPVRAKAEYITIATEADEKNLCRNYYNKAVRDLVQYSKKQGGDAVIGVESVVFLEDGRRETYKTPECSDDGGEGQILAQGIAIKWKAAGAESGAWVQPNLAAPAGPAGVAHGGVPSAPATASSVTPAFAPAAAPPVSASAAPPPRRAELTPEDYARGIPADPDPLKEYVSDPTAPVTTPDAAPPAPVAVQLTDYTAPPSATAPPQAQLPAVPANPLSPVTAAVRAPAARSGAPAATAYRPGDPRAGLLDNRLP